MRLHEPHHLLHQRRHVVPGKTIIAMPPLRQAGNQLPFNQPGEMPAGGRRRNVCRRAQFGAVHARPSISAQSIFTRDGSAMAAATAAIAFSSIALLSGVNSS
jgi:hypothetical protein